MILPGPCPLLHLTSLDLSCVTANVSSSIELSILGLSWSCKYGGYIRGHYLAIKLFSLLLRLSGRSSFPSSLAGRCGHVNWVLTNGTCVEMVMCSISRPGLLKLCHLVFHVLSPLQLVGNRGNPQSNFCKLVLKVAKPQNRRCLGSWIIAWRHSSWPQLSMLDCLVSKNNNEKTFLLW